jgi:uncharacterized protein YndB with AHSA1/START domain
VDARNDGGFELSLPSDREIMLTRSFRAPRGLVFEAWTRPEHVRHWYGCATMALVVCEIDLQVGGSYCYVMRGADGISHGMEGTYRDIEPPGRLVYTERYVTQGFESNEALVTVTFVEQAGRTTLTSRVLHGSTEDRDAHLKAGMETGAADVLGRLAQHLETMAEVEPSRRAG